MPDPEQRDTFQTREFERVAALIAEADADIVAGRMVDAVEVNSWIDSIDTDHELPVPYARL